MSFHYIYSITMYLGPWSAHEDPLSRRESISTFLRACYAVILLLYYSLCANPSHSSFRCSPTEQHSKLADIIEFSSAILFGGLVLLKCQLSCVHWTCNNTPKHSINFPTIGVARKTWFHPRKPLPYGEPRRGLKILRINHPSRIQASHQKDGQPGAESGFIHH